jgi:Protein of unknown function (DUF1345)
LTEATPRAKRDWGEGSTLLFVAILLLVLPNRFTLGGPLVSWTIGSIFVVTCVCAFVSTAIGSRKWANAVMRIGAIVLAISILASVIQVLDIILFGNADGSQIDGLALLETALSIWVCNVAIFAVLYHWIGEREFVFPSKEGVAPAPLVFLDYLFLSFTTSTAFSPTDTAPLTTRARMLIMVESIISLMMIALAAARAVNILT